MIRVSIIGGSGYTGGELLRLLIPHPEVEVVQVTSRKNLGEYVYQVHPNLRGHSKLKFTSPDMLELVDVLFTALPHGLAQQNIEQWSELAGTIIDLSADFRLRSAEDYEAWYGKPHQATDWLDKFVYGLPEINYQAIQGANYISGVGCNATASILALLPLITANLIRLDSPVLYEIKVGSSEGGAYGNPGTHHPERSRVVRTFSAFGHRHTAEVIQAYGLTDVQLTMTAVEMVRGILATAHVRLNPGVTQKDLWQAYRQVSAENPFLRVVKERRGLYRVPEPKILAGSNYADIGFEFDAANGRGVFICAIDNLMKGAAGSAVQSMNLALGFEETLGLEFMGLHPA